MPAGWLRRRAAGMEDGGAFHRRETGEIQFFERAGWHGGNLGPMRHHRWRQFARRADFPVGGIGLELEREQFQSQRGELRMVDCGLAISPNKRVAKWDSSGFMRCLFGAGFPRQPKNSLPAIESIAIRKTSAPRHEISVRHGQIVIS